MKVRKVGKRIHAIQKTRRLPKPPEDRRGFLRERAIELVKTRDALWNAYGPQHPQDGAEGSVMAYVQQAITAICNAETTIHKSLQERKGLLG